MLKWVIAFLVLGHLLVARANWEPSRLWQEISADAYQELPTQKVDFRNLVRNISQRARDTLAQEDDILPPFTKFLHANGVCLFGEWQINENTSFGGFFKKGKRGIVIARASTTLDGVLKNEKRGFAHAIKLFAGLDADETLDRANIFLIDTLAGKKIASYSISAMTNFPDLGFSFDVLLGAVVAKAFLKADKNPLIRQLYPISELGEPETKAIRTPYLMKLQVKPGQRASEADDFRNELLELVAINEFLVFDIWLSDRSKVYKKVGEIRYQEAVASFTCDHRLHFQHPVYREDIHY